MRRIHVWACQYLLFRWCSTHTASRRNRGVEPPSPLPAQSLVEPCSACICTFSCRESNRRPGDRLFFLMTPKCHYINGLRFFSYQRLTRSGGVGQGRAILRAAQRAKRLDGRWSGGYFAPNAEGTVLPLRSRQSRSRMAVLVLLPSGCPSEYSCGALYLVSRRSGPRPPSATILNQGIVLRTFRNYFSSSFWYALRNPSLPPCCHS